MFTIYLQSGIVNYCIHIAFCQIETLATAAIAKKETVATTKIKGILKRADAKAT